MAGNSKEISVTVEKVRGTTETSTERPFGQRDYKALFGDILKPEKTGEHYKYTILIPIKEYYEYKEDEVKLVFTAEDVRSARRLFQKDFGGITFSYVTGDWIDNAGRNVINEHAQFVIVCQKNDLVLKYFAELKARLLLYADEVRNTPQEEVFVDRSEADFGEDVLDNPPLEELRERLTKLREKLKNLKR